MAHIYTLYKNKHIALGYVLALRFSHERGRPYYAANIDYFTHYAEEAQKRDVEGGSRAFLFVTRSADCYSLPLISTDSSLQIGIITQFKKIRLKAPPREER